MPVGRPGRLCEKLNVALPLLGLGRQDWTVDELRGSVRPQDRFPPRDDHAQARAVGRVPAKTGCPGIVTDQRLTIGSPEQPKPSVAARGGSDGQRSCPLPPTQQGPWWSSLDA